MAERPPPLPENMRALLGAYRAHTAMPEEARERVAQRLVEPEVSTPPRSPWRWGMGAAVAAGLLLWLVAGLRADPLAPREDAVGSQAPAQASTDEGGQARVVPPPQGARRATPTTPPPTAERPDAERVPPTSPPESAPAARTPPRVRTPKATAPPDPPAASRLGEENRLIARTWSHVRAAEYDKARAQLDQHARTFAAGVLAPEREALRVIVQCLEHPEHATAALSAYERRGQTALRAKVREACRAKKTKDE